MTAEKGAPERIYLSPFIEGRHLGCPSGEYCIEYLSPASVERRVKEEVEKVKAEAKEELESCAVSFGWIAEVVSDPKVAVYARNCASIIRTGDLPPKKAAQADDSPTY